MSHDFIRVLRVDKFLENGRFFRLTWKVRIAAQKYEKASRLYTPLQNLTEGLNLNEGLELGLIFHDLTTCKTNSNIE